MTLTTSITLQADQIIRDIYSDLQNKGAVSSFIERSTRTSDFDLPDKLVMRAKEEKDVVYYHVFRKG